MKFRKVLPFFIILVLSLAIAYINGINKKANHVQHENRAPQEITH